MDNSAGRRAAAIMIQGTMSGAGKSLLCAALCRIFAQDGFKVAPFKSQNMALNSFVTHDGFEMGRAQAVQAQAAGVEPSVDMNPILLKPCSDTGSQVIVHGEVRATMSARDYFAYKVELIPEVLEAYERLSGNNDIIVIEGAGSPAEINLRENDMVNMGLARMLDTPVLLVGDIDRGGVFAQLYGTVKLLEPDEQQRIKGLVINKFRGDSTILAPGIEQIEQLLGIPVVGVVPFVSVDIDEEDSLAPQLLRNQAAKQLDVAVIRLPRISNFTDFDALDAHPMVGVRYVESAVELGKPDLVILPGTKSTISDLIWLRESGLEATLLKLASRHVPIMGICGGYQMLGTYLRDPFGYENESCKEIRGLGLLPVETIFQAEKTRKQVRGRVIDGPLSGCEVEGYEIHTGETIVQGQPLIHLESGGEDGCLRGNVCGTYLHGIFDRGEVVQALAQYLCENKGVAYESSVILDRDQYLEQQFDVLADALRSSLDMTFIYNLMGVSA